MNPSLDPTPKPPEPLITVPIVSVVELAEHLDEPKPKSQSEIEAGWEHSIDEQLEAGKAK